MLSSFVQSPRAGQEHACHQNAERDIIERVRENLHDSRPVALTLARKRALSRWTFPHSVKRPRQCRRRFGVDKKETRRSTARAPGMTRWLETDNSTILAPADARFVSGKVNLCAITPVFHCVHLYSCFLSLRRGYGVGIYPRRGRSSATGQSVTSIQRSYY
jgi:hypothetical protein